MSFLSSLSPGAGSFLGGAIGAVGSLIGGGINASNAREQMAMQREFAQNGIRWKVADAKAAGIHPLAALGAQTFSYNPVMAGDQGVSEALARMGQGVDRAAHAKALEEERLLDSELKRAQIRNVEAQTNAVMQQVEASKEALRKSALPPPMPPVEGTHNAKNSVRDGVSPFWEHFRNMNWITPVPSGDLKDYVSENNFINFAMQLAYADAAWRGQVRPSDKHLSPEERRRIKDGFAVQRYYPFIGWRTEPSIKHYLYRSTSFLRDFSPLVRAVNQIRQFLR